MNGIKKYAQRMLNPYHGIINVVEIEGADAVTRDGVEWMLYLQGAAEEDQLEDGTLNLCPMPDIKYGTWSEATGLKRAPVRSVVDFESVEARGQTLLSAVKSSTPDGPFPLTDCYELWLLESGSRRPIALLESTCESSGDPSCAPSWRPGQASHREFVSRRIEETMETGDRPAATATGHASLLEQAVNSAAGDPPVAQWFLREPGGSGRAVTGQNLPEASGSRALPREAFPELMLATEWADERVRILAEDFVAWQAPWLLQLQHLGADTRSRLERAARRRALLTASLHHLYPTIMDPKQIRAALVEARLRAHEPATGESEDPAMATFYTEMAAFTVGN
ncbi:MAG: hypothetical protein ABFS23_09485 [Pseudomonadota bacterium]